MKKELRIWICTC